MSQEKIQSEIDSRKLIDTFNERVKELRCLEIVSKLLRDEKKEIALILEELVELVPQGMQYPEFALVRVVYLGQIYQSVSKYGKQIDPPEDSRLYLTSEICESVKTGTTSNSRSVGSMIVFYAQEIPDEDFGPFLDQERRLVDTIARKVGSFIAFQNLHQRVYGTAGQTKLNSDDASEWKTIIAFTRRMDYDLFLRISRKMLNYLCWNGVQEASTLLQRLSLEQAQKIEINLPRGYQPSDLKPSVSMKTISEEVFKIANRSLSDNEILVRLQKWMQEDRSSFLIKALVNLNSSLGDVSNALRRFSNLTPMGVELSDATRQDVIAGLIQKLITDQIDYTRIARKYLEIEDFHQLIQCMIFPQASHGHIGGKGAGMILADKIIRQRSEWDPDLQTVKTPKTWYITTDAIYSFLRHNNLEEVSEQKYKNPDQVRQEYPHIVQLFKNSTFTSELIQGLSAALDDFGEHPIVVRSSSLLEDRFGISFSGKYKSLFLINQGRKTQRLQALMDAIAEVYASTFGVDPISYRGDHGLLEFKEEMGVIIQEVVGCEVGDYFLPLYSGIAHSNSEIRWHRSLNSEDGLIRIVAGMGTRATDRLNNDYPVIISPVKPAFKLPGMEQEAIEKSPHRLDVINLKENSFVTVEASEFFTSQGLEMPYLDQIVSIFRDGELIYVPAVNIDFEKDRPVVTFEGLFKNTDFIQKINKILSVLKETLNMNVEIEFASNGQDLFLLQCRPVNRVAKTAQVAIPTEVPVEDVLFRAENCIFSTHLPVISHVIFIETEYFQNLLNKSDLNKIRIMISKLNRLLPPRNFIIMAPARFGSAGDPAINIPISYADFSNTAALAEFGFTSERNALQQSVGSGFFKDLLETSIQYLQIFSDSPSSILNQEFFTASKNNLGYYLPDFKEYEKVVKVIDIQRETRGKVMRITADAELNQAIGYLTDPVSDRMFVPY